MKSISAREVFQQFPHLRKRLWAGEFWSDGYFVRSVGDEVTAEVIRNYIRYQMVENACITMNQIIRSHFGLVDKGDYSTRPCCSGLVLNSHWMKFFGAAGPLKPGTRPRLHNVGWSIPAQFRRDGPVTLKP